MDGAATVVRQFTDLVDRASQSAENIAQLREAVAEATKTSQWISGNVGGGGNPCIPVVNSFNDWFAG
jgi:predicted metal-dependent enzyme (double-stranded beta helix superfamily)